MLYYNCRRKKCICLEKMEEKIGDLIKRLRIEKGYSIEEFSEKTGYTTVQIKNIESNKNQPRIFNLNKIAEALDCNYDYLYSKLK